MWSYLVVLLTSLLSATDASPARLHDAQVSAGPITPIFEFGYNVELENLAIRPNGNILATEPSPHARVWEIIPSSDSDNGTAAPIAEFNATSAVGIARIGYDLYAVTSGNLGPGFIGEIGSFTVNILDYTDGQPEIVKVIPLPNAHFANKITALNPPRDIILVGDSQNANILSVNVVTGEVGVALSDPATMRAAADSSVPIGVNGIHTVGNALYYINTSKGIFNRVELTAQGTAAGPFQTIANYSSVQLLADDFGITSCGDAFLAGSNEILYVSPNGTLNVVVGNEQSTELAGATSALFGNGPNEDKLYITTTGHISKPATQKYKGNGRLISVQISGL